MKKFILSFLLSLTVAFSFAQSQDVLKFLGIPVDGSKEKMISELKKKGFKYNDEYDALLGEFNGKKVHVFISTYHDKVDRVFVCDENTVDVAAIKIAYNNLLRQFEKNEKYFCLEDYTISPEENISYEMTVNHKRYDATFFLKPNISDEFREQFQAIDTTDTDKALEQFFGKVDEMMNMVTGQVWFTIFEHYGQYYLGIYYDNLLNRPNGDEL